MALNLNTGHLRRAEAILEDIGEAMGALTCPYFRGDGTCHSGCRDYPDCWDRGVSPAGLAQLIVELTTALQDAGLDSDFKLLVRDGMTNATPQE